ncbi:MAG: hypothetical protein QXW77_01500 [Candidatus Hadarchaeales archaeon]
MKIPISWGIESLDELTGGIQPAALTLLYGDTTSGKTTLSGYVTIARIAKHLLQKGGIPEGANFYVVDGDGGWDIERASEVWQQHGLDPELIKRHLVFKEVSDFGEQHEYITKRLPERMEKGERPLLLVADSLTAIYRREMLREPKRVPAILEMGGKLDLQVGKLRKLAVEYNCPAFVTTWPSSPITQTAREAKIRSLMKEHSLSRAEAEQVVPKSGIDLIGGKGMLSFSRLIIRLSIPKEGEPLREARLVKAKDLPTGRSTFFYLCDAGISDVEKKIGERVEKRPVEKPKKERVEKPKKKAVGKPAGRREDILEDFLAKLREE